MSSLESRRLLLLRRRNRAALDLRFAALGYLPSFVTFARSGTATYFGSDGLLKTAADGVPRFDYDPATRVARGLQFEESRTNLALQSNFQTGWITGAASVNPGVASGLDGTASAASFIENSATAIHQLYRSFTAVSGTTYCHGVVVKRLGTGSARNVQLQPQGTAPICTVDFDLDALTATVSSGSAVSKGIIALGGGKFLCWVSWTATANGTGYLQLNLLNGSTASYLGDGASGLYVEAAQNEAGSFPTSIMPTTTTAVTRNADDASITSIPWFNAAQGSFFLEAIVPTVLSTYCGLIDFTGNTPGSEEIQAFQFSSNARMEVDVGGATQANLLPTTVLPYVANRYAGAYAANDFAFAANGSAVSVDTSGTLPTITKLQFARINGNIYPGTFWLRRFAYFARRLPNVELKRMST